MSLRFSGYAISAVLLTLAPAQAQAQRGPTEFTLTLSGGGDSIVQADTGEVLCRPSVQSPTCVISLRPGETVRLLARPAPGRAFAIWQGPCAPEHTQYSPRCVITGGGPSALLRAHFAANEASAISSLRTMVSSQAMFYQGDINTDDAYDYATDVSALPSNEMVDGVLGDGNAGTGATDTQSRPQRAGRPPPH